MTQQPTLFSREQPPDSVPPRHTGGSSAPRWLQFVELSVRVIVRLYLGLVLVMLPWTHFWSDNRFLIFIPHLAVIALSGTARGIVSGLGFLNIWIAIDDAIHFRQE